MYDVAIIGGGPAGGSAAIYTAKANKKTVIIDSNQGVTKRAMLYNHYGISDITRLSINSFTALDNEYSI